MNVQAAGKTHIGRKRKINEDNLLVEPDLGLYVVADGMGGHKAGDVASRMVVETMADYWLKVKRNKSPSFLEPVDKDVSDLAKHLINAISLTNIVIHEAQKKPEYHRMGSTLSALLVEDDRIWAANVGDSRTYLFDRGSLVQVSQEHSVEAEQRAMGLTDAMGSTHPGMKNLLTRVMGQDRKVDVYITSIRPETGDLVLMCSDGLTNYMTERAIGMVLDDFSTSLERKADILIDEANRGGGGDNISVILLEVLEEGTWSRLKKKLKR
ncbi:MAG: protein phosphatase 2C domain-containing protein [Deltaproteobacteria bacterium]|nr:protein phosphatase 2C domain-containing protein [Deltaproteobacteria bacterium]